MSVPLRLSGRQWLAFGDLPTAFRSEGLLTHLPRQGFVLRGCPPEFRLFLQQHCGGQQLETGREALLKLADDQHFQRRKLRGLIRQGQRQGQILELEQPNLAQRQAIQIFYQQTIARYPALLRWLYRDNWQEAQRLFVFQRSDGLLALLTLSQRGPGSWHSELMLRAPMAPPGVIEALLAHVHTCLQHEGDQEWSLGEVPFYPLQAGGAFKAELLTRLGRQLAPCYSAEGLLRFKAKFRPHWRPVELYGMPDLNWMVLWDLFQVSRCAELFWQRWKPW